MESGKHPRFSLIEVDWKVESIQDLVWIEIDWKVESIQDSFWIEIDWKVESIQDLV